MHMKRTMKNQIKAMMAIILSFVFFMTMGMYAFAASPREDTAAMLRATKGDYYADQWLQWQDMMDNYIHFKFSNAGFFCVKETKLYAREIVGMYEDGSYIIGPWKLVHQGSGEGERLSLPGDYVMFAFGYDVTWGTDWPYSDVFWTDAKTRVREISIYSWGEVRTPGIHISVNGEEVYDRYNLPSHKQWQP